jgi:hypothetical protein
MPTFLAELPTWPEVERELKARGADPATVAPVRKKYWDDFSSTEEIKALPPIRVEAARSRFFQEPVTQVKERKLLLKLYGAPVGE